MQHWALSLMFSAAWRLLNVRRFGKLERHSARLIAIVEQVPMKKVTTPWDAITLLSAALCFGTVSGVLEGLTYLGLKEAGVLSFDVLVRAFDLNILWAAPLVNTCLFVVVALALVPFLPLFRPASMWMAPLVVFGTMLFYSMISVPGRIRERGALILALGLAFVLARRLARNPERMFSMFRRGIVPAILMVALVASGCVTFVWVEETLAIARLPSPRPNTPNVLLVMLDTLRYDRVGPSGKSESLTPFLDQMAQRSVVFDRAFAHSSWTLPSHISIFTGYTPQEHGAAQSPYDGRFPTLAEVLSQHGYLSVGFVSNNFLATRPFGMSRGFVRWENIFTDPVDSFRRCLYGRKIEKYILNRHLPQLVPRGLMGADEINRRFLQWLDSRSQRPFFAYLNYMEMHLPSEPPAEIMDRFELKSGEVDFIKMVDTPIRTPEEIQKLSRLYDALTYYLDSKLRELFEELANRNMEENLLVIITSDHGESLGERDILGHRNSLYLEQVRVPLVLSWAGHTPKGFRVSRVVGLNQLPVTIAQLTGVNPHPFPGASLVPCWHEADCSDHLVLGHVAGYGSPSSGGPGSVPTDEGSLQSIVFGQLHYIRQENGKEFLFDWLSDPREERNLVRDPAHQPQLEHLRQLLDTALDR